MSILILSVDDFKERWISAKTGLVAVSLDRKAEKCPGVEWWYLHVLNNEQPTNIGCDGPQFAPPLGHLLGTSHPDHFSPFSNVREPSHGGRFDQAVNELINPLQNDHAVVDQELQLAC